ncbi:MAG: ABC-three component system middle component 8 [Pseudomonadota bacterium]
MLRPTKHSHPDRTVINVAMIVLVRLKKFRIVGYSDLLSFVKKKVSGGNVLFLPALDFLFIMGLVEYRPKTDSIEYIM